MLHNEEIDEEMKILIYTPSFYPNVGGLETVNYLIAQGLAKFFNITVVTPVINEDEYHEYNFRIVRSASIVTLMREYLKCDVFVHSVLSLKGVLPIMLFPKKWVVIHHTCYFKVWDKTETLISHLKKWFTNVSHNICVSDAVGKSLGLKSYDVIHNSYDSSLFTNYGHSERSGYVFVGRLVTEKGVDVLIEAYRKYCVQSNRKQKLYIIGDGPMMARYKNVVLEYGLEEMVVFLGQLRGKALVDELNKRYCMIVPSRYKEAFGIVALEGLATGCQLIGSDGDGISEAIGECGLLFQKGDSHCLAEKMLQVENVKSVDKDKAKRHLECFTPEYMVRKYVDYFKQWERKS